jgi:hypothetical protein
MTKKLFFVLLLAIQAASVVSVASADIPMPTCLPCPGDDIPKGK